MSKLDFASYRGGGKVERGVGFHEWRRRRLVAWGREGGGRAGCEVLRVAECGTHVLNNVFNVIIYLVKQMSANLVHIILINVIQNAEANLFLK